MYDPKAKNADIGRVPTVTEVGAALLGLGLAGLARPIISFLLTVPFAIWFSLTLIFCGAFLLLAEGLHHFFKPEMLSFIAAKWMENAQATGMKMMLLGNLTSTTPDELKIIFAGGSSSGCSPTVSGLIDAQDAGEVMRVLATSVRDVAEHACAEFIGASADAKSSGAHASKVEKTLVVSGDDLKAAVAWTQQADSLLAYDDQLEVYGLAQQASLGDCREELVRGPVASAKKDSWEAHRGMSRNDAAAQLADYMMERDRAAQKSYPHLLKAKVVQNHTKSGLRMLCDLIEKRLPLDVEYRVARVKRRVQFFAIVPFLLSGLTYWRHRRNGAKRPPLALLTLLTSLSSYLVALSQGLPAVVYSAIPRALRTLPAHAAGFADRKIGGAAPRLLQLAMQSCMPPASIYSRHEDKAID